MYTVEAPVTTNIDHLMSTSLNALFSYDACEFIADLSRAILESRDSMSYPELVAAGYWMRKSNIERLKKSANLVHANSVKLPRGIAFHIAPSNVETIFLYSWILSMLAGNHNIIRISSKPSLLMDMLIHLINDTSKKHKKIAKTFMIIRYDHDDEITKFFSLICDIRIIWGGDKTIDFIRSFPLKPTTKEVLFSNKFSLTLINAEALLKLEKIEPLIVKFYNDVYSFNQMACSSPRLIIWQGNVSDLTSAQKKFWNALEGYCHSKKKEIKPSTLIDKIETCQLAAAEKRSTSIKFSHPYINRIKVDDLSSINFNDHPGGGLFYEGLIQNLDEMIPILDRKIQTLGIFGYQQEELIFFFNNPAIRGVDRIVNIGDSLNFSNNWDGYQLLDEFTRQISIEIRSKAC